MTRSKQKKPTKRTRLRRLRSTLTLTDLKGFEAEAPRAKQRPDGLLLKDIHVAPSVFQWRLADEDIAADELHVRELARVIQSKTPMKPLDAILVTAIGKRFFVVDGHHRLDAYHTVGWKGRVPVQYLEKSLDDAQIEALKRNIKNQLPVTRAAKSEAAWRLMAKRYKNSEGKLTWEGIADLTTVDRSTVARMNRALKRFGEEVASKTWADARRMMRDKEAEEAPGGPDAFWDEWKEKQARKLADYLVKGPTLLKDPEVTARALEMVSGTLPGMLVGQWPDAVREEVQAWTEDMQPEDAAQVETALELLGNPYYRGHGEQNHAPEAGEMPDTANTDDF